jgi:hypothetical protein
VKAHRKTGEPNLLWLRGVAGILQLQSITPNINHAYSRRKDRSAPVLNHPDTITVRTGETFQLDARGSNDSEGDSLSFFWFEYREAGDCPLPLKFNGAENLIGVSLTAPKVEQTATAHVILQVSDKGSPPLSRYKRVIVTIAP